MFSKWARKRSLVSVLLIAGMIIGLSSLPVMAEKTVITFWKNYVDYVEEEMQRIIADYEAENPDIKIDYVPIPGGWEEYATKLQLAFAAGREPDIFIMDDSRMGLFVGNWLMAPAPDKVEELMEANAVSANIVLHARGGIPGGPITTIPLLSSFTQSFYNGDLVAAAGLSGPAKTWDQFVEYALKMTKRDADGNLEVAGFALATGGSGHDFVWQFTPWLICAGQTGLVTKTDPPKSLYNTEKGVRALQFWVDLVQKHKVQDLETGTDVSWQFARGEAGIVNRSLWFGGWSKGNAPDVNIFSAPMPADEISGSLAGTIDIGPTKGVNQDKAWDFIYWLVRSDENMARFAALHTRIPPTKTAANRPELKEDPFMAAFATQENLVPRPIGEAVPEYEDILGKYIELALYGRMGAKEALDAAVAEVNELLASGERTFVGF